MAELVTANDEMVTAAQHRLMHLLWRQHGVDDRSARLRMSGVMLNRDVDSSRSLTRDEATTLIDQLVTTGPEDLF